MKSNPSQYSGTLKKSVCTRCGKDCQGMTRVEQDKHEQECIKQKKLFGDEK